MKPVQIAFAAVWSPFLRMKPCALGASAAATVSRSRRPLTRMHAQQSDDFYIDRSDYTLDNTVAVSADDMDNMLAVLGCAHPGESD